PVNSHVRPPKQPLASMGKHQTSYDPETAPNPATWLSTPESSRVREVATFHMVHRESAGNQKAHAAMHVAVENQIAMGFGPTVRAMQRLQSEGLSRHEAVHAVASVLAEHLFSVSQAKVKSDSASLQNALNQDIEYLSAKAWRTKYGST
ncbi:DUF1841 family protein, partial [Piscinibacter sakaiensis]|uniref:DUF1841 family protein n=1 Tax=Piscinibacter sakaiensis TaxID=1547922 RepID=UPI001E539F0B